MRAIQIVNLVVLMALWAGSAAVWPELPDRIPVHFGASGQPDGWRATTLISWFSLPLVALVVVALNELAARVVVRKPQWLNVPQKEQFLALPAHRQAVVLRQVQGLLWGVMVPVLLLLCVLQFAIFRAAQGQPTPWLLIAILLVATMSTPLLLAVWLPAFQRALKAQLDAHETETRTGTAASTQQL